MWYRPPGIIESDESIPMFDKKYFKPVIEALAEVFKTGTAYFLKVDGIEICGKTGTADNFARVNGKKVMLKPHSVFVAFAPKINPKIAIAVLVENAGFGAAWAAPIAGLMIEKYLTGEVKRKEMEKRMIDGNLIKTRFEKERE